MTTGCLGRAQPKWYLHMCLHWKVHKLLPSSTQTQRTWNQNMLQQHFLSFEADQIKIVSLCWTVQKDCLIWPACNSGEYSVKTGYKLLCEEENSSVASSSDRLKHDLFWKCIWKLCIPNKIKMFLWRVCYKCFANKGKFEEEKDIR